MIFQVFSGENLALKLAEMQENGKFCDFSIIVSGTEIKAHKCVLASTCEYFNTSFQFNKSSETLNHIDLTHLGCEAKYVQMVIRSFYTNDIDLDLSYIDSVLQIADYFMCENLKFCIESYMEKSLNFNSAVMYFQLALQYRLNSTGLFNCIKWFLWFRFHDYFIYQLDTLDSNMEVINAFVTYGIFNYCNPLQIVEFMLQNVKSSILQTQSSQNTTDVTREDLHRLENSFSKIHLLLDQIAPDVLNKWKCKLAEYTKEWREKSSTEIKCFSKIGCHLKWLEKRFESLDKGDDSLCDQGKNCPICCYHKLSRAQGEDNKPTQSETVGCSNPFCQTRSNPAMSDPNIQLIRSLANSSDESDDELDATKSCKCTPKAVRDYLAAMQLPPTYKKSALEDVIEDEPLTLSVTAKNVTVNDLQSTSSYLNDCNLRDSETDGGVLKQPEQETKVEQSALSSSGHSLSSSSSLVTVPLDTVPLDTVPLDTVPLDTAALDTAPPNSGPLITRSLSTEAPVHQESADSDVIVVLAPSTDMTTQLMATDAGKLRPLLKSPQLELSYYDIDMKTWRQGFKFDFPIQGVMLDKQSWRVAFLKGHLYMFSLSKELGLELNTSDRRWTHLSCKHLFSPHENKIPVKSIIPIAVGERLVVLSMSKDLQVNGEYLTEQRFYEMDPSSKQFHLVASVQDEKMDLPITQWTVLGDVLITVKTSTMMYRQLSRVQYFHVYNSSSRELQTHKVVCAMEAGVKVLARDSTVYLFDNEGWCRSYDLVSSSWTGLSRHSVNCLSAQSYGSDDIYPALTRASCHAGSSRWEISTSLNSVTAHMQELLVDDLLQLKACSHPPPPFQFVTAMCPGRMSRKLLDGLECPKFRYIRQNLDFSFYCDMTGRV
ncbi:uncharacterized protein LOC131947262 [Physella acuta]|uniref:uncharacterized protein LOC131947262 n=1 Tax=Physella acuta TaxID=109671 RepID=UPI0027DE73D9|nr:uncharacterized protein LOC131947262 [Physella acuta]